MFEDKKLSLAVGVVLAVLAFFGQRYIASQWAKSAAEMAKQNASQTQFQNTGPKFEWRPVGTPPPSGPTLSGDNNWGAAGQGSMSASHGSSGGSMNLNRSK